MTRSQQRQIRHNLKAKRGRRDYERRRHIYHNNLDEDEQRAIQAGVKFFWKESKKKELEMEPA